MAATDTTIFALNRHWDMVSNAVAGVGDATPRGWPWAEQATLALARLRAIPLPA